MSSPAGRLSGKLAREFACCCRHLATCSSTRSLLELRITKIRKTSDSAPQPSSTLSAVYGFKGASRACFVLMNGTRERPRVLTLDSVKIQRTTAPFDSGNVNDLLQQVTDVGL
jgi:hypothetical protein